MTSTLRSVRACAATLPLFSLLTVQPAAATTPTDALVEALQAAPSTPDVAAACAPAGDVLGTVAGLAAQSSGTSPDDAALTALLNGPAGLTALGVDVDAPLVLTLWNPTGDPVGELDLPFVGDAPDAQALLQQLALDPTPVPNTPATWVATDGQTETRVRLVDGHLALSFNGSPPERNDLPAVDVDLVGGLPATNGCAAWVAASGDELGAAGKLVGDGGLAVTGFLPFQRDDIGLVRFRSPVDVPAALSTSGRAPVTGSSVQPPSAVVTVGLSMADLLDDSAVVDRLKLSAGQVRKLQRYANIGSGSTVAVFGDPRGGDFAAVLPLDGLRGPTRAHRVTRRMRRLARKAGLDVLRSDDRSLVVSARDQMLFVEVRDGRIYLAAHGPRALEAAEGQGSPWVNSDDLAWALQWPIAAWSGPGGPTAQQFEIRFHGGVRAVDDVFEIGVRVQTNAPPGFIGNMLTTLLSMKLARQAAEDAPGEDAPGEDAPGEADIAP